MSLSYFSQLGTGQISYHTSAIRENINTCAESTDADATSTCILFSPISPPNSALHLMQSQSLMLNVHQSISVHYYIVLLCKKGTKVSLPNYR